MREDHWEGKALHVAKRSQTVSERAPWKLLLWTAVAGLIFGLLQLGEPLEDTLRSTRNTLHMHRASGDIVLVLIDDKSLREVGNWPWRRSQDAALVDRVAASGAKRIFLDINLSFPSTREDDTALAGALQRAGRVTLFSRSQIGQQERARHIDGRPLPIFARHASLALATFFYNYQNAVWQLPWSGTIGGQKVPSFAAALANRDGPSDATFPIDYSIEVDSVPAYSALDVLNGRVSKELAGKQVLVGTGSEILNDNFFVPGYGRAFGVQVHALGAETLKSGTPVDLGWIGAFLFGIAAAALGATRKRGGQSLAVFAAAIAAVLAVPALLEARLIFADITPGLFVLLLVGGVLTWRRFRVRGLVNPVSNLPNLNALRANKAGREQALIAARILNYEEIVANLPANGERQLIEQIISRLTVGAPRRVLYQGDGGIFAWFEEPKAPFGNHLDALYSLFRNPARVGGLSLDLTIAFGVEVGSSRSLPNRLASALVAAEEAAHDGLKWKYHDPDSLQDASWKLSMLSQLDSAIDRGEVWVAYQPKLDLRTRRIVGAEALARWTHPEKGPIAASEFIAAAEQHDRISKLTDFVLEKAVAAATSINKRGGDFGIAVNLSARLLTDKGFTLRVSALLARHKLAPEHLTLELTETAALADSGEGLEMIASLRNLGIHISIDDYGTGLSTLEYLKKIPANEIKIDQSFVKAMIDNRSDRLMVQSTIGLAHSLGRQVVAEGVEQSEILDALVEMGCDIAQGFAIGRPMSLESLVKRISGDRRRQVA
jgi:EAL domain-containing protein (putative c-di-GMP-specific phosphodiesterase class I)/CHASE2 domain-containing sensor protein